MNGALYFRFVCRPARAVPVAAREQRCVCVQHVLLLCVWTARMWRGAWHNNMKIHNKMMRVLPQRHEEGSVVTDDEKELKYRDSSTPRCVWWCSDGVVLV